MQSKTKSGISRKARETLGRILDHLLQDECLLSATTRDYGWHLTGPNLYSLHRLFEEQRRQLDAWLEKIATAARAAGLASGVTEMPCANVARDPARATLPTPAMIVDLRGRHEEMAARLRKDLVRLSDAPTASLLKGLLEFHETTAWMLHMVQSAPQADRAI